MNPQPAPSETNSDQPTLLDDIPLPDPVEREFQVITADEYVIRTSPETDAFLRAQSDRDGRFYKNDEQSHQRVHNVPGHSHDVYLQLSSDEVSAGKTLQVLEKLTSEQDADGIFASLYLCQLLCPPGPTIGVPERPCIVDLDDLITKIGWRPRSTAERQEMRAKAWSYIKFGQSAVVRGARPGKYYDRMRKEEIETRIHAAPWTVLQKEYPAHIIQPSEEDIPLRVELAMANEWRKLASTAELAQYLPLGEVLGMIPGKQPSGAWAKVIGLCLANFWRRHRQGAVNGTMYPTRRQLLETYPPTTGSVRKVLDGANPRRAIEYWVGALNILVQEEFLAPEGEALVTVQEMRKELGTRFWQERWLEGHTTVAPGPKILPFIHGIGRRQLPTATRKKGS